MKRERERNSLKNNEVVIKPQFNQKKDISVNEFFFSIEVEWR
jgi:hypothetical protein